MLDYFKDCTYNLRAEVSRLRWNKYSERIVIIMDTDDWDTIICQAELTLMPAWLRYESPSIVLATKMCIRILVSWSHKWDLTPKMISGMGQPLEY